MIERKLRKIRKIFLKKTLFFFTVVQKNILEILKLIPNYK